MSCLSLIKTKVPISFWIVVFSKPFDIIVFMNKSLMSVFYSITIFSWLVIPFYFPKTAIATTTLTLSGSSSFTGTSNIAMPITDLQIGGDSTATTPVKLLVTSGTLAMSTTTGLTFTGSQTGSVLYFSGTVVNINAALATLTYTRSGTGSDTLEVSLVNSGEVFFPDNGHLYKYINQSGNWNSAQSAAAALSAYGATGYLATITSSSENSFVAARLGGDGWFGASDITTEGDWKWVTGPESGTSFWTGAGNGHTVNGGYANWSSGEPNDSGGSEDCAQFYSSNGLWNDLSCTGSTLAGFVVEFGATGNMPTVVSKNIAITTQNAPVINSVTPEDNATSVNPTSNLSITFSQVVNVGTGNILIKKASDNSILESIDVTSPKVTGGGTTTITINPDNNLPDLTSVYINIPNTAFKNGSNVFFTGVSDTTTWSFTTSDITPPTVPGIPSTTTPINTVTPVWSWAASIDTASGLQTYLLKWSQSSDCNGGSSATTNLLEYTIPGGVTQMSEGTWYLCVAARDIAQNVSSYATSSVVIDLTPPTLSAPTAYPLTGSADITWTTDELSSSKVEYSTTGDYSVTTNEFDISPKVTNHSVTLSGLERCTTYFYRVVSKDAATNSSSNTGSFMTSGCNRGHPISPTTTSLPVSQVPLNPTPIPSTSILYGTIPVGFRFKVDMRYKETSKDITHLQEFLKAQGTDIYPEGKVTGYFGPSTLAAVHRFQNKFSIQILTSIGLSKSTGFAGPSTRAQLNKILIEAGF